MQTFTFVAQSIAETQAVAEIIGRSVKGGEVFELTSDLGGGKTTFTKGFARGMGVTEVVQSPTFNISLIHKGANDLELHHFDFYRLTEAGVMRAELAESLEQPNAVVVIEWGDIVHDILPEDRVTINLSVPSEETRIIKITCKQDYIAKALYDHQHNGHTA